MASINKAKKHYTNVRPSNVTPRPAKAFKKKETKVQRVKAAAAKTPSVPVIIAKAVQPEILKGTTEKTIHTSNISGMSAYKLSPFQQLCGILFSSTGDDRFYESQAHEEVRLKRLIQTEIHPELAAKAIIYARKFIGLRTISHIGACAIAEMHQHPQVKGQEWGRKFFRTVVQRVDDIACIVAAYMRNKQNGKTFPNYMQRGLADSFRKFDEYQFAKYRGLSDNVKLVDAIRLIHPSHRYPGGEVLEKVIKGELGIPQTWETELSAIGQLHVSEAEKEIRRHGVWEKLLIEKKLGYLALLRNLRNIQDTGNAKIINLAITALTNPNFVQSAKVLPVQFLKAFEVLTNPQIRRAVSQACELSFANVPTLKGYGCVIVDTSGSMMTGGTIPPKRNAALLGAQLLGASDDVDLVMFSSSAAYKPIPHRRDLLANVSALENQFDGGSTNFAAAFDVLKRKYDWIVLLSDNEANGYRPVEAAYKSFLKRTGSDPLLYCFNLDGYGSIQFPEPKVFALPGASDKTLKIMKMLESDPQALLTEVLSVEYDEKVAATPIGEDEDAG